MKYSEAIDILMTCYNNKGVVFTMGCGGSASTASHFTADLAKTVGGFKSISLVDNIPLVSAITNDLGWNHVFEYQLNPWLTGNDVLVGFSVHGGSNTWSNNLVKAMRLAKKRGAKIIGFTGASGGKMKEMADVCFTTKGNTWDTVEGDHSVVAHKLAFKLKKRIK